MGKREEFECVLVDVIGMIMLWKVICEKKCEMWNKKKWEMWDLKEVICEINMWDVIKKGGWEIKNVRCEIKKMWYLK